MNGLREALHEVASDAPALDLADWAITGSRRRRRARLAVASVSIMGGLVVLVGVALGVVPGIRTVTAGKPVVATETGGIADLPGRGVGPLSHAYRTFCLVGGPIPADCRNGGWRVVTRSGATYHVPQALGVKSGPTFYPLAISRDGRVIAYYSRSAGTFQVRDLESGAVRAAPVAIAEAKLGGNARLELSNDGRYLAFTGYPSRKEDGLIIDMRARTTTPLPAGWDPRSIDGTTVTLARYGRWGQKPGIWVMPLTGGGSPVTVGDIYTRISALSPDGAAVAALAQGKSPGTQDDTISVLDARTGRATSTVTIRGLAKDTGMVTLGAWLNAAEVTLATFPSGNRQITYAVNVRTGQVRKLAVYRPQAAMHLVVPGAPATA
ncbi:TolB family protein [Nonomuraea sp. CA-143628]|uniref:TolB family protein n=1 Tax=Nonomuraea sp. CA-143628 TaxID=3239997 RepID=UPI003D8F97E4